LAKWLNQGDNNDALKLDQDVAPALVRTVIEQYAPDLNDAEII